jgi:hypothetical protein
LYLKTLYRERGDLKTQTSNQDQRSGLFKILLYIFLSITYIHTYTYTHTHTHIHTHIHTYTHTHTCIHTHTHIHTHIHTYINTHTHTHYIHTHARAHARAHTGFCQQCSTSDSPKYWTTMTLNTLTHDPLNLYNSIKLNFMFCWPCILVIFVMKANLMHYLSVIYFVTQPLHVSGICCPSSGGIRCICTAFGTCYTSKLTGCWSGQDGTGPWWNVVSRAAAPPPKIEIKRNRFYRHFFTWFSISQN